MSERVMARVVRIDAINPIKDADQIEVAQIGGWKVVVKKGEFQANYLAVYADDPHEKIREVFVWKSYGKNFSQPDGVYTLLKDLTDDHLGNIVATQTHLPEYMLEMFRNEVAYRKALD